MVPSRRLIFIDVRKKSLDSLFNGIRTVKSTDRSRFFPRTFLVSDLFERLQIFRQLKEILINVQKLPIRFGETIKAYDRDPSLSVSSLKMIPLVFAGWLRYLMAVDDNGTAFDPSPDPLLSTLRPVFASCRLGDMPQDLSFLDELLSNESIWGVNLFSVGLADLVKDYFQQLTAGPGAVKATLEKYLG